MSDQLDYHDPRYTKSAAEILRRHNNAEPEANLTSAVRDFTPPSPRLAKRRPTARPANWNGCGRKGKGSR